MISKALLKAEPNIMKTFNFALQQNCIPLIRSIRISNDGDVPSGEFTLRITAEPGFIKEYTAVISSVDAGRSTLINPVPLIVSTDYLFSLTEKVSGYITIMLISGEETLFEESFPTEILAYDEWTGADTMPEMLSAFMSPNHPAVAQILSLASLYLKEWGASPSLDGYQSQNPNNVKKQAAAIYAALQEKNIAYIMPPASYEKSGQRIRLPERVLEEKHGTCIDLSLLYASCLEACGLNPLIIIKKDHAFAGLWLEDRTFSDCAEDDVSAISKRCAEGIDELCLVECTDLTAGKNVDFASAERHAVGSLSPLDDFCYAVDIRRCRGSGVRPIPSRVAENGVYKSVDYGKRNDDEITGAPKEIDLSRRAVTSAPAELTRQAVWERKLLDLSLRNSLLNFRPGSANVQLMVSDLAKLEDVLSDGAEFRILPAPAERSFTMTDGKIFKDENERGIVSAVAESEFRNKRIRTYIKDEDLDKTLKKLHRQAKMSIEENGANTLYLALGFMRWYESEKSEKPRYAPIILIPVDIVRKIQDRSYSIRIRDEDTQMNITLLEMLRQDHGISIDGLDPLPTDEHGVDIPLIFSTVRQGIMSKKHWDIEELAFLSQFSFSRFIMWNDIRNRAQDLKNNKVVASLISGKMEWEPQNTDLSPHTLDAALAPSDLAVPASADSSQLAAIYEASLGNSFVLHGPPGTGKSQTITNMIANALFQGKSVLFVAEKMAALSVVQKRLVKIGLDPFCLELHSNKAQKRAVLSQLEKTLGLGHIKSPDEYAQTAEKLHILRNELNETMEALYKERAAGMSVYDAIVKYEALKKYDGRLSLDAAFVGSSSAAELEAWKEAAKDISAAGRDLGGLASSPLRNVCNTEYSIDVRDSFAKEAELLAGLAAEAKEAYYSIDSQRLVSLPSDRSGIEKTIELLKNITAPDILIGEIISGQDPVSARPELEKLIDAGKRCSDISADISERFEQSIWSYDCDTALINWKKAQQSWFLGKAIASGKQVKELSLYAKSPSAVTKENIADILGKLIEYKQLRTYVISADPSVTSYAGQLWRGENTSFPALRTALSASFDVRDAVMTASPGLKNSILSIVSDNSLRISLRNAVSRAELRYIALNDQCRKMKASFGADTDSAGAGADHFEALYNAACEWSNNADGLRDRTVLENSIRKLNSLGLKNVTDSYRKGDIDEDDIVPAIECAVCRAVIASIPSEPLMSSFQGAEFERTIEKYKNTSARFEELTIAELAARLSSKIPDTSAGTSGSSEISFLQKAIRSGGRGISIRKLFDNIPNLLRRICPCMLMSPISVAQYIDPSFRKFDLVVFDEASQLPTSEAVGAIARGENVVVVGDPKQLPPTSFFTANQTDEDNYDKEDLESVLDDCLALAMPQKHLLWHYRSRHESLITYSNSRFYENSLRTFPSPDDLVSKVTWVQVEGFYDKGGSKQNKAEAQAIVDEISRRLRDPELRKDSIGVVTFNIVQQILIDDMLSEAFRNEPELETAANAMYEPILVKNLENVQGDERDVILFSIGYGPDKDGKVSMNFGPVNQEGGWRRLNVAVTRARKQMIVYSVIRPEQIDLSRTRSDGVAGLKGFLEFAAKGTASLPAVNRNGSVDHDTGAFAKTAAEAIRSLGYDVKCGIGSSDYKIDIGVINPDSKGTFLLGILCESESNYALTNARDRNIVQPGVLRGLGWRIINIHILDWLDNENKVIDYLDEQIEKALKEYRNGTALPEDEPRRASVSFERIEETSEPAADNVYIPYIPAEAGDAAYFFDNSSSSQIRRIITEAAEAEAPVSRNVIYHYVLASFGITKSSSKAEKRFSEVFDAMQLNTTQTENALFVWKNDIVPAEYSVFRKAADNGAKRTADEICPEEIGAAMLHILENAISIERSELIKEAAKIFGISRVTENVSRILTKGIPVVVRSGRAKIDPENGRVTLV